MMDGDDFAINHIQSQVAGQNFNRFSQMPMSVRTRPRSEWPHRKDRIMIVSIDENSFRFRTESDACGVSERSGAAQDFLPRFRAEMNLFVCNN